MASVVPVALQLIHLLKPFGPDAGFGHNSDGGPEANGVLLGNNQLTEVKHSLAQLSRKLQNSGTTSTFLLCLSED